MNKIKISILMFALLGVYTINAQETQVKERVKDKINAQRVAYITNQLELSESENSI